MATKLYKQTFKGRPTIAEVHDEIGRRGGLVMRIDQSDAGTTAYFEAHESVGAPTTREATQNLEEVSLKEVTKI